MATNVNSRPPAPAHPASAPALDRMATSLPRSAGVLAPAAEPRPHTARRRRRLAAGSALALLPAVGAGLWAASRRPLPPTPAGPPPSWRLDVRTGGGAPWVLVYGREAGFHLVRASDATRMASLPARVPGREVRMVSLGWAPLTVRGDAGGAGGVQSFSARARVVTVFQDGSGTGVRTGF